MRYLFAATVLLAVPSFASAQDELPELLSAAIAQNDRVPGFTFDVERTSTDTGEDGETRTGYARVDMSAPEFKQITPAHLINPDRPGSSFGALAGIESSIEDGIWCSSLISTPPDPDDVEIIDETADTIRTLATVVVSRENPAILSYEQHLTKPVTLYVVAKIKSADLTATCARGPDGSTYMQETSNSFEASGLGDSGGNQSAMKITAIYDAETGLELATN